MSNKVLMGIWYVQNKLINEIRYHAYKVRWCSNENVITKREYWMCDVISICKGTSMSRWKQEMEMKLSKWKWITKDLKNVGVKLMLVKWLDSSQRVNI